MKKRARTALLLAGALCAVWMVAGCADSQPAEEPAEEVAAVEAEEPAEAEPEVDAGGAEDAAEAEAEEDLYILPESDTRLYTEEELSGLSADQLRLARNEIYARHGRKFASADLQNYFDALAWYDGTIEPEDFSEDLLSEVERENIALIQTLEAQGADAGDEGAFAASWQVITRFGFAAKEDFAFADRYWNDAWSYSPLSFSLVGGTLTDEGEYYAVEAVFNKPVRVPADLQPGESCTVVINELTGEEKTFTAVREEGTGAEYYRTEDGWECWTTNRAEDGTAELLEGSADRLDAPFYEGVLRIRKDAVTGAAVTNGPFEAVTEDDLSRDNWFNVLAFDDEGYVTQLIFEGD